LGDVLTERYYASLDKTLSAVIACSFNAVTFSNDGGVISEKLQSLMTIVNQSLRKGARLSCMATYEGIKTLFANFLDGSRPRIDAAVVGDGRVIPGDAMEMVKSIVALLLPISFNEGDRFDPIAEKDGTEAVRLERARAVLAFASSDVAQVQDDLKVKAVIAVNRWLNSERSGPVRDVLLEARSCLLDPGGVTAFDAENIPEGP
jgi:hypothetical protein